MKSFPRFLLTIAPAICLLGAGISAADAAVVSWDGNGSPNANGSWETGVNWSSDAVPGAADNARLLDVTTGTRTVTIGTAQTINQLTITQTTVGAVNQLDVNENLTLTGTGTGYTPFVITATAGQSSIVTNIADGKTLLVTNTVDTYTAAFAGTVSVGENASFIIKNTGTASDKFATATFAGPITLADGAKLGVENGAEGTNKQAALTLAGTVDIGAGATLVAASSSTVGSNKNSTITLNGATTVAAGGVIRASSGNVGSAGIGVLNINADLTLAGDIVVRGGGATITLAAGQTFDWSSGSTVLLEATNSSGNMGFTNQGTLTMDAASVTLNFAATGLSGGTRRFNNTGDWTLTNGATVSFTTTTGREIGNEGFGVGANNLNSGTLRVEDGSRLEFSSLFNTGLMRAGSSTAGVSDGLVRLGNNVGGTNFTGFRTVGLNNGYTTGNSTLEILGDVWLGRTNSISDTYTSLENGTDRTANTGTSADASTRNLIQIGDGTTSLTLTVANRNVRVTNATDNTIDLKANAILQVKSVETSGAGALSVTNRGTFNHAGTLILDTTNNSGSSRSFAHGASSTYRISGTTAEIRTAGGYNSNGAILFSTSGLVTGSSGMDKLTYVNGVANAGFNTLTFTVNGGEIAPGNGTAGSGTSSIGTLELANINVTTNGAAKLSFDIGGDVASGLFDQISLTGTYGRVFTLAGTNDTLDIHIVNGFTTAVPQTYLILTSTNASGVVGTFDSLLYNGGAVTDEYTVNYLANGIEITFASIIPEPSTVALLVLAGVGLLGRKPRFRRRGTAFPINDLR